MNRLILTIGDRATLRPLQRSGELQRRLASASLVREEAMPRDVITMHSRFFVVDEATGERTCVTLTYPGEDCPGALSVVSPAGTALLGASTGQTVRAGGRNLRVGKVVYQPERIRGVPLPMAP